MRSIRSASVALFVGLVAGACATSAPPATTPATTPAPSSATQPPASASSQAPSAPVVSVPPIVTAPPVITAQPVVTAPPATATAGVGGGSITFEITGEYSASGELPFDTEGSIYAERTGGGWVAYFSEGDDTIRLSTRPDEEGVEYFDGESVVRAASYAPNDECTFNIERNDEGGPSGSAECSHATVHPDGATYVNFTMEWDVTL